MEIRGTRRETATSLLSRIFVVTIALAMALSAAFVAESARAAAVATREVANALHAATPEARATGLVQAAEAVEASWARPAAWHPGALEAQSWAYFALAPTDADGLFAARSINSAQRSLWRAPVQSTAWVRLAEFDDRGRPNSVCDARTCLERSWRAVPLAPLGTMCARLQLGHALHIVAGPDDPRIALMTRLPMSRQALSECASFLGEAEMFHLMMLQEEAYAEHERRSEETGRSPFTRPYD